MKREIAQKMGIREDTPVVIGASDGVLANVGVGAISPGSVDYDWNEWRSSNNLIKYKYR